MEKIHIRFMKDLRNHDFGELFDAIYTEVKAEKIDIPSLLTAIERLGPHSKKLLDMNSVKRTHPLTEVIQQQVITRTEYLGCLRLSVDAKMLSHIDEERTAARRLKLWLSTYKKYLFAPALHRQTRMVDDLMDDRKLSSDIKQATALLNLDTLLEAIAEINATIRNNHLIRLNDREEYIVDGLAIRDAAYDDLRVLITVLEANFKISTDTLQREQLAELSSSINDNLKYFRTLLRSRTTKKKNKKDVENAAKQMIINSSQDKSEGVDASDISE